MFLAAALLFSSKSTGAPTPDPVKRFRAVEAFTVELEVLSDDHMQIKGPVGFFKEQRFKEQFTTRINLTARHVDIDYVEWTGEAFADEGVQLDRKSRDGSWETQHVQSARGSGKTRVVLYIDELKKTWQLSAVEIPSVPGQESSSHHNLVSGKTESGQGPIELQAAGLRWLGREYALPSTGLVLHLDTPFPKEECGDYLADWDTALTHWGYPHNGRIQVRARPKGIDEPCTACGSVIGIENQSLGQVIPITGTPYTLHYRSDKSPGVSGPQDMGGWTFNVHHVFSGQGLELGDGRQRTLGGDRDPLQALADEIPGVVPAGGYLIVSPDGSEAYAFDKSGRHLRTIDAVTNAPIYEFKYNGGSELTAIVDAQGLATTIERGSNGMPTAIVSPYERRTELGFNNARNLISSSNPAGEKNSFGYSSTGLLTSMIDRRGFSHTYEYDAAGRLLKDVEPGGGFTRLSLTSAPDGHTVAVSTALGRTASYSVANQADGVRKRVVRFSDGTRTTSTTWSDGRRTVEFGDGTMATSIDKPDSLWINQASLSDLTVKLPSGLESILTVARSGTPANPSNPLNLAEFTETRSINGRAFTFNYKRANRTLNLTTPSGRSMLATLGADSRVTEAHAGGLAPVRITYDDHGRPAVLEQGPVGNARRYRLTYHSTGELKSVTDPLGQTNTFLYDAAGRVTQTTLPDGRILSVQYDAMGNLTAFTPAGRPAHGFEYDKSNYVTRYVPPTAGTGQSFTRYEYNADHQVTSVIRPGGQTINLAYDPAGCSCGKLSSLTTPSGQVIFTYHPTTGKLAGIVSPGGVKLARTYDGPLLTSETWSGPIAGSVSRRYNSDHLVTTHTVNGEQAIAYGYDGDGFLTQAGDLVIARSALNSLISGSTLSGVKENWEYNSFGEITKAQAVFKGSPLLGIEYIRDGLGRIITRRETIGGVTDDYGYTYDAAGRLVTVGKNGVTHSSYSYDANDNRLTVKTAGGTITGTYDDQDRLMVYDRITYAFTDNGELLTRTAPSGTTRYVYDVLGNVLRVNLPGSRVIEYLVDGRNRRIGKKVNGTLVQGFVYLDGLRVAAELDGNGKVVSQFIYGTRYNVPDYMISGGVKYRIIADHLGSPRLVVDVQTGAIAQRLDYDEFGNVLSDTKPGMQPFGFAGGLYDHDTKLTRFGARDYDASTGRWTAKDPIRFRGMSSNFYQYVAGDPVNRIDPLGLQVSLPDYDEAVCSWDAQRKKGDQAVKALDTFRGKKGERYGMETEGGSEIDLRHYAAAYNAVQKFGGEGSYYAFWASQILGLGMEISQCAQDSTSAFDPTDFLSNFIGALDAFQGNTPIAGKVSGPNGYLSF